MRSAVGKVVVSVVVATIAFTIFLELFEPEWKSPLATQVDVWHGKGDKAARKDKDGASVVLEATKQSTELLHDNKAVEAVGKVALSAEQQEEAAFLEKMKARMAERKARVRDTCEKFDMQQDTSHMEPFMLLDEKYKAIDCSMGKTGTTRFKQLFWQMMGLPLKNFTVQKYKRKRMYEKERQMYLFNPEYVKSVIVREPFQRLVSAYRQKLKAPNPEFPALSKRIRQKYSPVKDGQLATFSDFVNYLVAEAPKSIQTDNEHWDRYSHACTPCSVDYDVIGKQETIDEDSRYFLHLINAPKSITHGPPNKKRSDEEMSIEYYSTVKPRERVLELYALFLQDYILFNYPPPAALKLLFGNGTKDWQ